jgi:hypothetical protein
MKRIEIDKSKFTEYIKLGYSNPQLAAEFGCSVRVVANRKKEWGLLGLTPNNKTTKVLNNCRECIKCNVIKPVSEFNKQTNSKYGIRSTCKSCQQSEGIEYYKQNKEESREKAKEYYNDNKPKFMEKSHKRRACKLNATPCWYSELDAFVLQEMYELSKLREEALGIKYHIDHIIPLQNEKVCGLHWHANWQLLPAQQNLSKANKLLEDYVNG